MEIRWNEYSASRPLIGVGRVPVFSKAMAGNSTNHGGRNLPWELSLQVIQAAWVPQSSTIKVISTATGNKIAVWVNGIGKNTTYFACNKNNIQRLQDVLQERENANLFEKGFCEKRSVELFAKLENGN